MNLLLIPISIFIILLSANACEYFVARSSPVELISPTDTREIVILIVNYEDAPFTTNGELRDGEMYTYDLAGDDLNLTLSNMAKQYNAGLRFCIGRYIRPKTVRDHATTIAGEEIDNHCIQGYRHP